MDRTHAKYARWFLSNEHPVCVCNTMNKCKLGCTDRFFHWPISAYRRLQLLMLGVSAPTLPLFFSLCSMFLLLLFLLMTSTLLLSGPWRPTLFVSGRGEGILSRARRTTTTTTHKQHRLLQVSTVYTLR